jgi:hypothetical protein
LVKRPLVDTTIRTEFGDVLDDPSFYDVSGADRDLTYVPGFSDMRRARDLELAAVASGKKELRDAKLEPLPVNMRWTRHSTVRGEPDGRKQMTSGNLGYAAVNKDEVGKHEWLKAMPPGATVGADGSIRKGDTMLMVTDGKTAARNAARKAVQTDRMHRETAAAKGGLLEVGSRKEGLDPFVRQEAAGGK